MKRTVRSATAEKVGNSVPNVVRNRAPRYVLRGPLGAGGMGIVYDADDTRLHRRVAIKFSSSTGSVGSSAIRLLQEAVALARIDHPHICKVYDVDQHCGRPCIVMERLEGSDLKRHMNGRRLPLTEIVRTSLQIADALETAHNAGIVHQDIKPANVFITTDGAVKLLDFGLAVTLQGGGIPAAAGSAGHELLGTVSYIAPERILKLPITPRSDLFSLGAVIYEMATGRQPFTGATPSETLFNLLDHSPRRPIDWVSDLPNALDDLVMKLLDKRPARRYQSAGDVRRALLQIRPSPRLRQSDRAPVLLKGERHAAISR